MLLLEFVSQLLSFDQQRKVLLLEKDGSGLEAAGYQTPHRGYLSDGVQIQRKRAASLLNPDPFYELHLHATAALCSVWHPAVINTSAMNRVTVSNSNGAKWDTNKSVNRICFTSNRYFLATGEKYLWKWNIRSRCDSGLSYGWESTSVLPKHFFEPQLHFLRVHVEPVCSRFAHFFSSLALIWNLSGGQQERGRMQILCNWGQNFTQKVVSFDIWDNLGWTERVKCKWHKILG